MTLSSIEQIIERRKALGLSQIDTAKLAGLSPNYVCRLEGGAFRDPSYNKVQAIIAVLEQGEKTAIARSEEQE